MLFIARSIPSFFSAVSDASGRYSSQFHFGNGFWLGSSTLCRELNASAGKIPRNLDDWRPPFPLKFHVARMYLTLPKELELSVSTRDTPSRLVSAVQLEQQAEHRETSNGR